MSYVRMSDLAQLMVGGGGAGGGGFAKQATQATQYSMPGASAAPASSSVSWLGPSVSTPKISTSGGISTSTGSPGGGWGGSTGKPGGGTPGGGSFRSSWQQTTTTFIPGYAFRGGGAYVEGANDPYNMFGPSAVDDGAGSEESAAEYLDPGGSDQKKPQGPQNVFEIIDDPTMTGLGDVGGYDLHYPSWAPVALAAAGAIGLAWWASRRKT